jgi:RNA polymerase sigma factor (sigma-70 family)
MNLNPVEIRTLIHVATKYTGTPLHDEDLEQDIAVRALEAFQRLERVTHPRALLRKIVKDAVRDHWRRRRSSEDLEGIDQRFISLQPEFEFDLDSHRRIELLRRALGSLSESKRVVLEFFYMRDYSIPQIASIQNRSISAVKMDLARSRRSLAGIVCSLATKKSRKSQKPAVG